MKTISLMCSHQYGPYQELSVNIQESLKADWAHNDPRKLAIYMTLLSKMSFGSLAGSNVSL